MEHCRFDLLILDINLPGLSGTDVLRRLDARGDRTPALILTARSEIDDRTTGPDLGADDYVVKPIDFRELAARARVLVRRRAGEAATRFTADGRMCLSLKDPRFRVGVGAAMMLGEMLISGYLLLGLGIAALAMGTLVWTAPETPGALTHASLSLILIYAVTALAVWGAACPPLRSARARRGWPRRRQRFPEQAMTQIAVEVRTRLR